MSRFRDAFSNRHVILPIIHVVSPEQALANARIARDAQADGCFLISHGRVSDGELLDIHQRVVDATRWWVGINCLSMGVTEVFERVGDRVAGVQVDDALIDEEAAEQPGAQRVLEAQRRHGWRGLYFGGVAFKYQRPVKDPARAAAVAAGFMDVVTTSGPGTAQAAPPERVRAMKQALADAPLALASGVTPENVNDYLPFVDCFLASTGVSYTFESFDPARLRDLVRVVRAWAPRG
jgi:predicted TIM-barrel enzyme